MVEERIDTRQSIVDLFNGQGLDLAAKLYGSTSDSLRIYEDYLGCQNIVYDYEVNDVDYVLRVSHRSDRPLEQVKAEAHFVKYLAENGARVSRPVPSIRGNLVETLKAVSYTHLTLPTSDLV